MSENSWNTSRTIEELAVELGDTCDTIYPIKKILEKTPMNDQFSSFYSKETQERDHFYEKFFIGIQYIMPN
ncbi:hypothetical protein RhiirA1_485583 [Rhizophagus irregularis]|uniref:Uncharacterized protein n=1 Tax=Rhizophagus irregularis TaxID=588596 RepID=A0A2N0QI22_9GLOM|nr:hypothetical protein RhiirA1_485583 [Rhizophagus irregularis]